MRPGSRRLRLRLGRCLRRHGFLWRLGGGLYGCCFCRCAPLFRRCVLGGRGGWRRRFQRRGGLLGRFRLGLGRRRRGLGRRRQRLEGDTLREDPVGRIGGENFVRHRVALGDEPVGRGDVTPPLAHHAGQVLLQPDVLGPLLVRTPVGVGVRLDRAGADELLDIARPVERAEHDLHSAATLGPSARPRLRPSRP